MPARLRTVGSCHPRTHLLPAIVVAIFVFAGIARADVIYLKSGDTAKGLIVEEHRDRVVLSTEQGERPVPRGEIDEVFYDEPERNYLYLGNQALEAGDLSLAKEFFHKAQQINGRFSEATDAISRVEELRRKKSSPAPSGRAALEQLELQWGIALSPGDRPTVASVKPGSLGGRAGLAPGDELVAAWGASLAYLPPEQAAAELLGPPGSELKLTVQRRLTLPKSGKGGRMTLEMDRLGLTATSVKGEPGLRAQDRIIAIDGQGTRYMPLDQARRKLQQSKQEIGIIIHRDLTVQRE